MYLCSCSYCACVCVRLLCRACSTRDLHWAETRPRKYTKTNGIYVWNRVRNYLKKVHALVSGIYAYYFVLTFAVRSLHDGKIYACDFAALILSFYLQLKRFHHVPAPAANIGGEAPHIDSE